MLKYAFMFLIGCSTDVSISKTYETDPNDTSVTKDTTAVVETAEVEETDDTQIQETQDEDTDNNQDLSKTIGYVEMGLMQASCPYCMGLQQEINTTAKARFHQETTAEHTSWLPAVDGCRDYYESSVSSPNVDMGQTASLLNTFGDNIQLNKGYDETGVIYENSYIQEASFRRNTSHTLNIEGKIADNVLETLRGFDYIEPYQMLYVDPSYAFQAPINKNGNNSFSWGPSGDINSFFTIHISVYSFDGSIYYGTVICKSEDTGYMMIPGSNFQQYQSGDLVSIHLMRHRVNKQEYELFNGTIESYSWWEVIGTGYIQ
jgi:hypothetical protein